MVVSSGPLQHHLGAFSQQEAEALLSGAAPAGESSSSFNVEVDARGVLWLVRQDRSEGPPPQKQDQAGQSCSVHDPELLCELMDAKASFELTLRRRFSAARARSNPFEALVEGSPFLNRSALKMANLNHLVGGLLPEATSGSGITFVDLCGGPGGFSQYVLAVHEARSKPARGWGITLEGDDCPWDLESLGRWIVGQPSAGGRGRARSLSTSSSSSLDGEEQRRHKRPRSPSAEEADRAPQRRRTDAAPQQLQQQQVIRLCIGEDGTGDLCRPENVRHFASQVRAELRSGGGGEEGDKGGVDLVMADGGFAAARSRFDQEARMLPLIVAQAWAMTRTLKPGGHFVCKLFEATLQGTAQVLALLACIFDRVALVKPVTSRPASAERYVVCLGRRPAQSEAEAGIVDALLLGMLLRAAEGHTDGYREQPRTEAPTVSSMGERVWGLCVGEDAVFMSWLRAVNDRLMRCQLDACHAILEAIARDEEGEEEEGQGQEVGTGVVQAYMKAWGLDLLQPKQSKEVG